MNPETDLENKNILILGYAKSGQAAANFFLAKGAQVTLSDNQVLDRDQTLESLLERGLVLVDGQQPVSLLEAGFDFIVKNPGIPYSIPILQAAKAQSIPIYTDIEIASWYSQAPMIAITGSNGKTTTTALINEILGEKAILAGNIGIPILSVVGETQADKRLVMEISSFQLQGTSFFKPKIGVITNIYPTHLDYHGSMEAYIAAKLKIAANLDEQDFLVYNYDQEILQEAAKTIKAIKLPFSRTQVTPELVAEGLYLQDGQVIYHNQPILSLDSIKIPGDHNIENVLAALAVAVIEKVDLPQVKATIEAYKGMPHRIEHVASFKGREFYNDSKATNMTATITALASFNQDLIYIGGGLDRGNEFDDLIPHLGHIKQAFLYGETKEKMAKAFEKVDIPFVLADNLREASHLAYQATQAGQVLLFSPACASWDQFKSFEIRGDQFKDLIAQYIQDEPYIL